MKKIITILLLVLLVILPLAVSAVETAPRINDVEIIERLTRLEEGQKHLEKRMDDLRAEMNSRFNTLEWMFGIFITISLVILSFVLRMQWQMQKRMTTVETTLSTHTVQLR